MRTLLPSLALALLCLACRSSGTHAPTEAGAHRAHQAYVDAINSNDVERMLAMLTDDVVFMSPNEPVMVGKDALRPWLAGYVEAFETHWDKPVLEFIVNGDWAFERYSYKATDTPLDGSEAIESTGWGLVIYHHDADGKWRVARDAWGPDHP